MEERTTMQTLPFEKVNENASFAALARHPMFLVVV
jgi:hypothetical protein